MTKQQLWSQRIAAWQHSGLTQSAFCQQQGWAISTFNRWWHKLKPSTAISNRATSSFLPVVVKPSQDSLTPIRVQTPYFSADLSIQQLAQLIRELDADA